MNIKTLLQSIPCPHWTRLLSEQCQTAPLQQLLTTLHKSPSDSIFPPTELIFNAFSQTPFEKVKVVILGQDPYHQKGQAHGLAFSVPSTCQPPPSLKNIFTAIKNDVGTPTPQHGDLTSWAKQGVLLLNSTLTVKEGLPQSHQRAGWQSLTDHVIESLNHHPESLMYLLWGATAQKKRPLIDLKKHTVLMAPHPSPLSAYRGFLDCAHFSKTNDWLIKNKRSPIDWEIK